MLENKVLQYWLELSQWFIDAILFKKHLMSALSILSFALLFVSSKSTLYTLQKEFQRLIMLKSS